MNLNVRRNLCEVEVLADFAIFLELGHYSCVTKWKEDIAD